MKITWFGGTTFRLYVGGRIFVTDADKAPSGVDPHEVAAAADYKVDLTDRIADFPFLDAENWERRRPLRVIDAPEEDIFELYTISGEGIFIDEPEEGPVIIAPAGETAWGHFADDAVVILFGESAAVSEGIKSLTVAARPKLIAIATSQLSDVEIGALSKACRKCPMQVLEAGLSLEA